MWTKVFTLALATIAVRTAVPNPSVLGIAHVGTHVSDLALSRAFYCGFLGFEEEPFTLKNDDGTDRIVFIKVNDYQHIELFSDIPLARSSARPAHIALYSDDASQLRDRVVSKGIRAGGVRIGTTGNKTFTVNDADGHPVEVVEYVSNSWIALGAGERLGPGRISAQLSHVGLTVREVERSLGFYTTVFGFVPRLGGSQRAQNSNTVLTWVHLWRPGVPTGGDYLELMALEKATGAPYPSVVPHVALAVSDVQAVAEELRRRAAGGRYRGSIQLGNDVDGRCSATVFDPDGTRIDLTSASGTLSGVACCDVPCRPRL